MDQLPQFKKKWLESMAADPSVLGSALELRKLCRQLPKIDQAKLMVMDEAY